MKRILLSTFSVGLLAAFLPTAQAALVAYEGYNYPDGTDLSGTSGGLGWSTAWGVTTNDFARSPSMTYVDSLGNALLTAGNRASYTGVTGGTSSAFRDLALPRTNDNTTTWISFIGVRLGNQDANGTNVYLRAANVSFFNAGSERLAIGQASNASTNTWAMIPAGSLANRIGTPVPFSQQALAVLRIDHLAGNDNAYLWLNPDLGTEPSIGSAAASSVGAFSFDFNRVRPFAGDASGSRFAAQLDVDELRIGDTFLDVTPFTPVPEPGTYALMGMGLAGLLAWRRRRS